MWINFHTHKKGTKTELFIRESKLEIDDSKVNIDKQLNELLSETIQVFNTSRTVSYIRTFIVNTFREIIFFSLSEKTIISRKVLTTTDYFNML